MRKIDIDKETEIKRKLSNLRLGDFIVMVGKLEINTSSVDVQETIKGI